MAMKAGLSLSQHQKLALTPVMRQSLAVLQMSSEALRDVLSREASENPFLDLAERRAPHSLPTHDFEQPAAPLGLYQSLAQQIVTQRLEPTVEAAALMLAGELRNDGYLDVSLEDFASELALPTEIAEKALVAVQSCDPAGVGARSLAECLMLQLVERGIMPNLAHACVARLAEFAGGQTTQLARDIGIPKAEIDRIGGLLGDLSPTPVRTDDLPTQVRVPDLVVERNPDGTLAVATNPLALPHVRAMKTDRANLGSPALREFYDRAGTIALAVAARRMTLLQIAQYLIATQHAFFDPANQTLAPDRQRDAASHLSLHPSTLSRAIRDKSLFWNGRAIPLSLFFQSALPGPAGSVSSHDVQRRIREIIHGEDPSDPLADDRIASQLNQEGVDIARRTVAKYRKCMRIPSSFARRRHRPVRSSGSQTSAGFLPTKQRS